MKFDNKKKNSKKIIESLFIVFILSSTYSLTNLTLADTNNNGKIQYININYEFNDPTIEKIQINDEMFDRISFSNTINFGKPNEPSIPIKGAYILLPPNTEINKINVERKNSVFVGSNYLLEPGRTSIPISKINNYEKSFVKINKDVYNSAEKIPNNNYSQIGIYNFRGYKILVLELYPVEYCPMLGELYYYNFISVNIELNDINDDNNLLFRGLSKDKRDIIKKIDNPKIIETYPSNIKENSFFSDDLDLLIITTNELKNSFDELKEYHNNEGIITEIVTIDTIGGNDPEIIRQYIKDVYINRGLEYVLIGGDDGIIPSRMLWVYGLDEETTPYTTELPSDLYYSCLDGPFNYDNDDKWGEPNDGENGNDVDLFAEVYIGRACVDNKEETENFVKKTISYIDYQNENDSYINEVLLLGENLGNYGIASWSGNYLDQLIDNSTDDGYTTKGIPSYIYNINTKYDRDQSWSNNDIIDYINNNEIFIINHNGHSNYHYNMRLDNEEVNYLENEKPIFIYSQGCNSGGFDEQDCIAEAYTVKTESAAFAGIWNARYGWFWAYSTDGDSQRFNREFWDAVFGENIPEIGKANQDSKEDNLFIIGRSCIRWCYYQLNLFGDPSVSFYYNSPKKPQTPNGKKTGIAGSKYNYSTSTTDPNNDQIFYMWDFGDGNFSSWIGPINSGDICWVEYEWKKGNYDIRVKAKDINENESPWSNPLSITMPININFLELYLKNIYENLISFLIKNI